jgi:hypothetical protein
MKGAAEKEGKSRRKEKTAVGRRKKTIYGRGKQ